MASARSILLFLCTCVIVVKADECILYDFEGSEASENSNGLCSSLLPGLSAWSVGNYSEVGVEGPANSSSFISPSTVFSCWSSNEFSMSSGGTIEILLYLDSDSVNQITVIAFQSVTEGSNAVVGTNTLPIGSASGWQTLRIESIVGSGSYQGYISLLGTASTDSLVLVDSFKYLPPNDDCQPPACVTYNFETDFEIRFTNDNYHCNGFLPWHLDNYTSAGIESPNPQSQFFMAPNEYTSCISSFKFRMEPNGVIEVNIYMETLSAVDHIIVMAQKLSDNNYDTIAGFKMYYPDNQVFVPGWNVLRFPLLDFTKFEGYLVFIGGADKGSTVLVDSVRYIPPNFSTDDDSCSLY